MKKLLLSALLVLSYVVLFSQDYKTSYYSSYFGNTHDISYTSDKSRLFLWIDGETSDDNVLFLIDGNSKIESFSSSLKLAKEKFKEWSATAHENNITDFSKNFDIVFPSVTVTWDDVFGDYHFEFHITPKSRFVVTDAGLCVFVISGTATASDNKYMTQQYYLALASEADFDELINAIDLDSIQKEINKHNNIDSMFQ